MTLDNDSTILSYKYHLFDDKGTLIQLDNEYDGIFVFTIGVAVVCMRNNMRINGGRFTQVRKDGLIGVNGKELLPCVYNSIGPKLDGSVEISKDGRSKVTCIDILKSGRFNWDEDIVD